MEASKTLALIRSMRHDFGNHLQIINGYSELGYLDEVKAYISQIVEEMNQERLLFELKSPELSLYLLQQKSLLQSIGVILKYDVIEIVAAEHLVEQFDFMSTVQSLLGEQRYNEVRILVSIYELEDQIKLVFDSKQPIGNLKDFYIKKDKC